MPRKSSFRDNLVNNLESQIDSLTDQVGVLRKSLAKGGRAAYAGANESAETLIDELAHRWADAVPHMRRGARAVERQAKDNPAAVAAVGLAVVGLLALMLLKKR